MYRYFIILILAAVYMTSCSTMAPYETKDVSFKLEVIELSSCYATIRVEPSTDAYYLIGYCLLDSGENSLPYTNAKHFMTMQLDQAYIDYLQWRHYLLNSDVVAVASFADHSLAYGSYDLPIAHLQPYRTYFFYVFAVDPVLNEPVGDIYYVTFTLKNTPDKQISFDYRIDDAWDFAYPLDSLGQICSTHPYYVLTVSQSELLEYYDGDTTGAANNNKPYWYFNRLMFDPDEERYYSYWFSLGVYSECHKRVDGMENVEFKAGETYYTGIFSVDGEYYDEYNSVYRFTWQPGMRQTFSPLTDDIGYCW